MNKQQFQRELNYGAAVSIATLMLRRRLITRNEFRRLKAVLIKKHCPVISSLQETAHPATPRNRWFVPKKQSRKIAKWNKHRKKLKGGF